LKREILRDVTPLLLELDYLHSFKIWASAESFITMKEMDKEEIKQDNIGLIINNKIRGEFPTELKKFLDYDLQKTKLMGS